MYDDQTSVAARRFVGERECMRVTGLDREEAASSRAT
jgi:hypothetical protein